MPLRFFLLCALLTSPVISQAKTADSSDIDTGSVSWLLSQINIGEAQQNADLVADSLEKLIGIAPLRVETQCALARSYFSDN